jgi:hypothetical protein
MNFNLLAADWWNWVIPAVFIIIYLLNHVLSGAKAAGGAKPPQPQRRRVPTPPPDRAARPQQPAPGQAQLNTEIEQFLKRANERRMEKARRDLAPEPASPAPSPPPPRPAEPAIDVTPLDRDFNAVEKSVKQHLGNRGFQERAEHLADDILRQEAEMQRHLEQAFSHRLGTLSGRDSTAPKAAAEAPPATADRAATAMALAGILTNQSDIRKAILLKEILERPIDRW